MSYTEHSNIKPERIAATAAAALEDNLVLPRLVKRETLDQFRGAKDDTINVKVEGLLPYRTYGWRNDRTESVKFDVYSERKVAVSFGGDLYSGVRLTDEQRLMDELGWDNLAIKQTDALSRGLEDEVITTILDAPYEVEVTLDESDMRGSYIKLKAVFDRLKVQGPRRLVLGSDVEAATLLDEKITLSQNSTEAIADSALKEALIGRVAGFNLVTALEMPTGEAVAMVDNAFVLITGSPTVPLSVKHGSVGTVGGSTVRWITDYDADHFTDRSLFSLYKGSRHIVDNLLVREAGVNLPEDQAFVSEDQHFVRAVKVKLGTAFGVEVSNSELSAITGIETTTP